MNEKEEKIGFFNRTTLKKFTKKIKNQIEKDKEKEIITEEEIKRRKEKIVKSIIEITQVMDITNKEGEMVTEEELMNEDLKTLLELFEEIIAEMEQKIK